MNTPVLSSIHIYPIKSTAGIALSNSWVDDFGLSFDRRFVLTNAQGKFITARTKPRLCLVQASLTASGLVLSAPEMPLLEISYQDFSDSYQQVTVWADQIDSQYCHKKYDQWFSEFLGFECQLHFFGQQSNRAVKNSTKQVGFADGYPLLLISQASLDDLNNKLTDHHVKMSQFRPNLVIENTSAFAEDTWQQIRIGEVIFDVVKPCSRCVFTTVDPLTGVKNASKEPLMTLKRYRQVERGEVMFGQNLIPVNKGQIKQGDKLTVLKTQPPLQFKISDQHSELID